MEIKTVIANPKDVAISLLKNVRYITRFFDEIAEPVPSLFDKIAELVPNIYVRDR